MPNFPKITRVAPAFESLKKSATNTATDVIGDVAESLGLEQNTQQKKPSANPSTSGQKTVKNNTDAAQAAQIRQNIARINEEMNQIRKNRDQKEKQEQQASDQQKVVEKHEEKKKESVFAKLLKARKGTKEVRSGSG